VETLARDVPLSTAEASSMSIGSLRCAVSGHDPLVRDNVQGTPVWRCPRCWQTHARERVEDPRPVRPPDARFVYDPTENQVLRRTAITALSAAERWRLRASRVHQHASSSAA
jgi:hypothetical protein